jgi:2-keto-3-deoxy-L-rhamnonate aldolase RhmA
VGLYRRPAADRALRRSGPGQLHGPGHTVGGIAFSADEARAMIARGYRLIVLGSDAGLISAAAQRMVEPIRA